MTAIVRPIVRVDDEPLGAITDDGFLVSNVQLARLGGGDVKRGRRVLRTLIMDEREPVVHYGPTGKPDRVRVATPEDEQDVYELILLDIAENASRVAPPDDDSIVGHIHAGTRAKGGICAVIDDDAGKPCAVCLIEPAKWWWSRSWHIVKVVDFVHPDHRGGSYARDLIQFQKWVSDEWSRSFGYRVYLINGVMATKRTKDKMRLYKRMMNFIGGFFIYPMPPEGKGA